MPYQNESEIKRVQDVFGMDRLQAYYHVKALTELRRKGFDRRGSNLMK